MCVFQETRLTMGDRCIQRHPSVQAYSTADGGAVLIHPDLGLDMFINPLARFIWERLYPGITVRNLTEIVGEATEGAAADEIREDIREFVEELESAKMVIDVKCTADSAGLPASEPVILGEWNSAPGHLDLSLTHRCNLKCPYCFYDDEMAVEKDLTTDQWLTFIDHLRRLPVRELILSGGEVFTRRDLPVLLDAMEAAGKRFAVLTNGTLVNDAWIDVLKRHRSRLSYVQFSVDGSCPQVHDSIRGPGTFIRTMEGLKRVLAAGLPDMVRMTITRLNAGDIEPTMDLLLGELGVRQVGTNDVVTIGAGCRINLGLTAPQHIEAMRSLVRMSGKYPGRIQASAGPLARYRTYRDIDRAMAGETVRSSYRMGRLTSCGCMGLKLAIRHDGMISPCNMLSDLHLGNILTDSLEEVWRYSPILKAMRDRARISLKEIEECRDCEYADYCTGNCPATRFAETGNLNLPNTSDCYRQFLETCGGIKPWNDQEP